MRITKMDIKFVTVMAVVVTSYISFTLVAVNLGFSSKFVTVWLRSRAVAAVMVFFSLLLVGPFIKRKLN
jgi:Protein of unknown function (DUF2798)